MFYNSSIKRILPIYFILVGMIAYGQSSDFSVYVKGEIITKNDTINGYLVYDEGYKGKIVYKLNKEDKKVLRIKNKEVNSLKVGADQFDRIEYKVKDYLMKQICQGKIALYEYEKSREFYSYYNKDRHTGNDKVTYTTSKLYLVNDGATIKVKNNTIKKDLKLLMIDHKELYKKIDDLNPREFLFNLELKKTIANYNFLASKK